MNINISEMVDDYQNAEFKAFVESIYEKSVDENEDIETDETLQEQFVNASFKAYESLKANPPKYFPAFPVHEHIIDNVVTNLMANVDIKYRCERCGYTQIAESAFVNHRDEEVCQDCFDETNDNDEEEW